MYFKQVISKLYLKGPKRNFSHIPYVLQMAVTSVRICVIQVANVFSLAASTKLLHDGQTPGALHPSLHQSHIKRDLITQAKLEKSPAGLGTVGQL
jgi:hypothetical protein